jgi:hypothetical protein
MSDTDRAGIPQGGGVAKPRERRGGRQPATSAQTPDERAAEDAIDSSERSASEGVSPAGTTEAQLPAGPNPDVSAVKQGAGPEAEASPSEEAKPDKAAVDSEAEPSAEEQSPFATSEASKAPAQGAASGSSGGTESNAPVWVPDLGGTQAERELGAEEAPAETDLPRPLSESVRREQIGAADAGKYWADTTEASQPPPRTASNSLALVALVLSILLPGVLYVYLSASGALERSDARVAALETSVSTLRGAIPPKAEVSRADLDKLAARLDDLEKKLATERARPQSPPSGIAAGGAAATAPTEAMSRDIQEALARAKAAEDAAKSIDQFGSQLAAVEAKLAALEKRVAATEQGGAPRDKASVSAPSILVFARTIASDLANGTPYAGELDALARLGADTKSAEALRPFAEKGAPAPASLAAEFEKELSDARDKVAAAERPRGIWDRLTGWLGGLVHVRHIGADEPGTPAANVETALGRDDLAAALDAVNALPVFEKNATPNASARIKTLAAAYDAARRISEEALETIRRASAENGG